MSEKINATCSICDKGYYMCLSCKDLMNLNPWKIHCCCSEHYKIYQIIHGLSTNVYTKQEANEKLKNVDLSDFDSLRDNIKNIIKDVMGENEKVVDNVADAEVESASFSSEPCKSNDNVENNVIFGKSNMSRKRKSFNIVEAE